jgi:hypothetical protein
MNIVAIHKISDPARFWAPADLPEGFRVLTALPNEDGTRGICVWEAESLEAVERLVESAYGDVSQNEFFELDTQHAQGVPA